MVGVSASDSSSSATGAMQFGNSTSGGIGLSNTTVIIIVSIVVVVLGVVFFMFRKK